MQLDLEDVGMATVRLKPDGSDEAVPVTFDLFDAWVRINKAGRDHPGQEGAADYLAALLDIMKGLGFPAVSRYAAHKFADWVCDQADALQKKTPARPASSSAPASGGSTASTPSS